MKRLCSMLALLVVVLGSISWGVVRAGPPAPYIPPYPPTPPEDQLAGDGSASAPSQALGLPPLKAVLLVGPIDGDYGRWTTLEKVHMDLAELALELHGVTVHKFYAPDNDWAEISAAAEGAHFFFYRGHGIYWNSFPDPTVGGLALKGGLVSSEDIRSDLHLAPNAIVMLYGCFAAGTESIHETSLSSEVALQRVAQYSDPFFENGAAGYYSNWFGDAFQAFVSYLFQGMTLGQAYEFFHDFGSETVERYGRPAQPDQALWLDKDYWGGGWLYNNTFSGLPDQTLSDLFGTTQIEVTPSVITHLAEPDSAPQTFTAHIDSTGSGTFRWTATVTPSVSWLDLQPHSGNSGQDLMVVITPTVESWGTYQASIRIIAHAPDVQDRDQTIPVTLHLVERVYTTHLPLLTASAP